MGFTAVYILLLLLTAFTLTTQELVSLNVSPKITAECGHQVVLNCNVSSRLIDQLSIKHMTWSRNSTSLCSVDREGNIIKHHRPALSDFHCEYKLGQLTLIFKKVRPLESGDSMPYMCKLHSNKGVSHGYTTVELQECCGEVEGVWTSSGPTCTFTHVYPDGDVHWFHGPVSLSDDHITAKSVDEGGWLTIQSHLPRKSSGVSYNCSLRSTTSGRHIKSALVQNEAEAKPLGGAHLSRNGAGSQGPTRTFLFISIIIAVTLK